MTGIYQCNNNNTVDYYEIVRDSINIKLFRLKAVQKLDNGTFKSVGYLTYYPTSKKKLLTILKNLYPDVIKL